MFYRASVFRTSIKLTHSAGKTPYRFWPLCLTIKAQTRKGPLENHHETRSAYDFPDARLCRRADGNFRPSHGPVREARLRRHTPGSRFVHVLRGAQLPHRRKLPCGVWPWRCCCPIRKAAQTDRPEGRFSSPFIRPNRERSMRTNRHCLYFQHGLHPAVRPAAGNPDGTARVRAG